MAEYPFIDSPLITAGEDTPAEDDGQLVLFTDDELRAR